METHGDHQSNKEFEDNPYPTSSIDSDRALQHDVAFTRQGILSKAGSIGVGNSTTAKGRITSRGLNVRDHSTDRWPFPSVAFKNPQIERVVKSTGGKVRTSIILFV